MNKELLKSIMVLNNDTNKDLAMFLGITEQSVSNKINETPLSSGKKAEFKQGEINKIRERYNLDAEKLEAVFFN